MLVKTMKLSLLTFLLISQIGFAFSANPNKTYYIKYILDSEGYATPDKTNMTVTNNRIYISRNGNDKYWDCEYQGVRIEEPVKGKQIKFHVFYLTNKGIYIIISDYQMVKHNGIFYYSIKIDGLTQLAL